jgi:hypothetical protein
MTQKKSRAVKAALTAFRALLADEEELVLAELGLVRALVQRCRQGWLPPKRPRSPTSWRGSTISWPPTARGSACPTPA